MNNLDFFGRRMYLAGEVKVSGFSFPKIYFMVQDYLIFYNIETFNFSDCECQHGSFWGINDEKKCKHVRAVKCWIIEELESFLKSQSSNGKVLDSPLSLPLQDTNTQRIDFDNKTVSRVHPCEVRLVQDVEDTKLGTSEIGGAIPPFSEDNSRGGL